ncbi:CARDB domain-containing protein [Halostagnicola kamekurae]|uniref:CARDB domain-containing protein n=1 Tax=Halostagnicola kamekurae TaxID=619731 RepID=UPI000B8702C0|nr:CARDB domain-containing protein [Halostagnicola kamekurae]
MVLCGLLLTAGIGTAAGAETDNTTDDFESGELLEIENQTNVPLATGSFDDTGYYGHDAVVTFDGDIVRGENAAGDETPKDPTITVNGEDLMVADDGTVETITDGRHVTTSDGNKTVTIDDNLVVTDDGIVELADGTSLEVDGASIEYSAYDQGIPSTNVSADGDYSEGEQLSVTVDITNVGYGNIRDEVELYGVDTDGNVEDRLIGEPEFINESGGNTTSLTFERELVAGDHQIDELRLDILSEQFTTPINITKSEIAITNVETNDPVAGEPLTVAADLERRGALDLGDRTVTLSVDGTEVESRSITLAQGASTTEEFSYDTGDINASEVDIAVAVPEDSNTERKAVTVVSKDAHNERMSATVINEPTASLSEELEVVANIDYDGTVPGGETVVPTTFRIGDSVEGERNVTVEDGAPTEATFSTYLDSGSVPLTSVTVETPGQSDTLEFERNLSTKFTDVDESFGSEESLDAVVTVENDGETPEVVELTVAVDDPDGVADDGSETVMVTVNPGESVEKGFSFEPTEDAPSEIELTAETDVSSDTAVAIRPAFTVEDVKLEGADNANSGLTMSGNVTNTGERADTQSVQFNLGDELVAEESVTLAAGESKTVETSIEPPAENGEYSYNMTALNVSGAESAQKSAQINVSGKSILDRVTSLGLPLALLAVLALLAIAAVALKYRDDPEALQAQLLTAKSRVQNAVQGVVGGGGSVIVENGLPRDSTVRLQIKDESGVVFQEDLQLADGEQREFPSLPGDGQFEVGVGVDDVASHSEVFQGATSDIGVVLQPDGIRIGEL